MPVETADFRDVRTADIYKSGHRAATLRRTPDGVAFDYELDYLSSGRPAVATTLPLSDQTAVSRSGAVPPFFAGLLPEGRRLSGLRRAVKTSADDELSLLLAVGTDTVGDVQVVAEGVVPEVAQPLVTVQRTLDEIVFSEVLEAAGVIDPVALPGVQDKASARMISVPVARAADRFILKVDPPEFPHAVVNEHFFLRLARAARVPAVSAEVVHDATGRPGLLVRRFDRVADGEGQTIALPVEDGTQVLGLYPADKYNVTAEALVAGLTSVCAATGVAARAAFQQLCFAWLTGNGDLHAKNMSVLGQDGREWRMAPAYDVPSTLPYGDNSLALPLGGRRAGLSRRRLLGFADSVGLTSRAAESTLDHVLSSTAELADDIAAGALPFTAQVNRETARRLRRRHRDAVG